MLTRVVGFYKKECVSDECDCDMFVTEFIDRVDTSPAPERATPKAN